jgi:hypothetical protein
MFHILLFLSSRIYSLGDSMCRFAHGILILLTRRRDLRLTTTLAALPSGAAITPLGPPPLLSIHKWSGSFLAEEYRNMFTLLSRKSAMIVGPLILLALLCVSFSSSLGNLSSAFFSWAQSATVKLFSFVHAKCRAKVLLVQMLFVYFADDVGRSLERTLNWPRSVAPWISPLNRSSMRTPGSSSCFQRIIHSPAVWPSIKAPIYGRSLLSLPNLRVNFATSNMLFWRLSAPRNNTNGTHAHTVKR